MPFLKSHMVGGFPPGWTDELEAFFGPLSGLFSSGGGYLARAYILGQLLPGERKSVQPIASRLDVDYDALQALINQSPWRDSELLTPLRGEVARQTNAVPVEERAMIIDDTGQLKKGKLSVGVQRQYTGTAGKTANCQIAVTLTYAWWPLGALGPAFSAPASWRLYLPQSWLEPESEERRIKAKIPEGTPFLKKWEIALEQLDEAMRDGLRAGLILGDAGYGDASAFRAGLRKRELNYSVGVTPDNVKLVVVGTDTITTPAKLAKSLLPEAWTPVRWRESEHKELEARFYRCEVDLTLAGQKTGENGILLLELRNDGELKAHLQHGMANLPLTVAAERAMRRWVCEQVHQQAKEELGIDHFEGRSWRGWYHHTSLSLVTHNYLALKRYQDWRERQTTVSGPVPPPRSACQVHADE